jgi:hypothetical protein
MTADSSLVEPAQRRDDASPQLLILGWCLFLLGSWTVAIAMDSPVPSVRWMFYACVVGLMVVWPLVRLSQGSWGPARRLGHAATPARYVLLDWLCLALVFQTVVWPLYVTAEWTVAQAAWLDAVVVTWTLLTAMLVALGCRSTRSGARVAAMAGCVFLLIGEPLVLALIQWAAAPDPVWAWELRVSPLGTIARMLGPNGGDPDRALRMHVAVAAVAGVLGWIGIWILAARARSSRQHQVPE